MYSEVLFSLLLLIALVVSGVSVGVLVYLALRWLDARRYQTSTIISRLNNAPTPAFISNRNGMILVVNEKVPELPRDLRSTLQSAFSALFVDAGPDLIYRLSNAVQQIGFTGEAVTCRLTGDRRYLACQEIQDDLLYWTVSSSEQADQLLRDKIADPLRTAPFPVVTIRAPGVYETNPFFRQRFGNDPAQVVEKIDLSQPCNGQRMAFDELERGFGLYRVFMLRRDGGEGQDILFLPYSGSGTSRDNASSGLEALPIALMQFDLKGRLLWANSSAQNMLDGRAVLGRALADMFLPLGRTINSLIEEAVETGTSGRGAMMRIAGVTAGAHGDGFRQISLTRTQIDGTDSLLAVMNDASELRQLEDRFVQSQKMEAVGKLAGGVAHDFNNVLTAIRGHCDFVLMGRETGDPDYDDLLQIKQNTNRAASMVRHLLAFSRQQTLQPALLNVGDVISDAHVFLNSVIGEKVSLAIDHGAELWPVMADRHQLEQVLMNLVVNARDAMPKGGTVLLETDNMVLHRETIINDVAIPSGDYVEIEVSDEGTGIPADVLERIFEPFFTTKAQGQGTGLGLSTVYGIIKQSGGFIFAQNRTDRGASFRILLPAVSTEVAALPPESPVPAKRDLTGRASVLLVEDEDSIRSVGSRALSQRGFEVVEAASAEEAMEILEKDKIAVDVLVSDVVMPGMDGPTFAVKAREHCPDLRLIFMSGYAEDNFRNTELGKDFLFLPKPFSINELTTKVKEALETQA
ncbi:MAG: ATP-binding protein [Pseudomonadota bacterium]